MKTFTAICLAGLLLAAFAGPAFSHCEVPCGIYGDQMRFEMILEDTATVEKSMKSIVSLGAAKEKNYNQLVRWINNKELHARKIQEIVWQYFLTQRIKPAAGKARQAYLQKLELLHLMSLCAMKMKQTVDLGQCKRMRELVKAFHKLYEAK